MDSSLRSFENIEQCAPFLRRMWCFDRRVVLFEIRSMSRETVHALLEATQEVLRNLKPGEPFNAVYDFLFPEATLTPYLRSQFTGLMTEFRNLPGVTALIVEHSLVARLVQLFLSAQLHAERQRRIFFVQEAGLNWIEKQLHQHSLG